MTHTLHLPCTLCRGHGVIRHCQNWETCPVCLRSGQETLVECDSLAVYLSGSCNLPEMIVRLDRLLEAATTRGAEARVSGREDLSNLAALEGHLLASFKRALYRLSRNPTRKTPGAIPEPRGVAAFRRV